MTKLRSNRVIAATFGGAALLGVASVGLWLSPLGTPQASATTYTVKALNAPESKADRAARSKLKVNVMDVELKKSRKLGEDAQGNAYLIAPRGTDLCLVVVQGPETASFTCNPASRLLEQGLWFEYGNDSKSYMAAVVPDEYTDGQVQATGREIARGKNLIAIETPGRGQSQVTFSSPKYSKPFVAKL